MPGLRLIRNTGVPRDQGFSPPNLLMAAARLKERGDGALSEALSDIHTSLVRLNALLSKRVDESSFVENMLISGSDGRIAGFVGSLGGQNGAWFQSLGIGGSDPYNIAGAPLYADPNGNLSIQGSVLVAGTVTATAFNTKQIIVTGLTLTNNSPSAGKVAWSACTVYHNGTAYAVSSGDTSSTTHKYIYWTVGGTTFTSAAAYTSSITIFQIATNNAGTADEGWQKLANVGVQRTNMGFPLLEGFAPQTIATLTVNPGAAPQDSTLLTESAEGGIISFFIMCDNATDAATTTLYLKITIDGATEVSIKIHDGAAGGWTGEGKTLASVVTGTGLVAGDYMTMLYGFSYRVSLTVKLNHDQGPAAGAGAFTLKMFYVHKT